MLRLSKTALCLLLLLFYSSCMKEVVEGCTDPRAENYTEEAAVDDGSCTYFIDKYTGLFKLYSSCSPFYSDEYPLSLMVNTRTSPIEVYFIWDIYHFPQKDTLLRAELHNNRLVIAEFLWHTFESPFDDTRYDYYIKTSDDESQSSGKIPMMQRTIITKTTTGTIIEEDEQLCSFQLYK